MIENSIEKNDGKVIFEGAINYPNDFFKSELLIPSLVEAERSFGCHFCCVQMEDTPLWLHGSNMLVRGDIEDEIGWDYDSIAEDSCFGYQIANKKGRVFGWHHGTLFEQPAYTIKDMIKQRKRWYYGTIQNLKYLGWKKKLIQLSFLISWKAGFVANMIGIPSLLGMIKSPEFLEPIFMFNLLFWIFSYQYGTYLNIRHIDMGKRSMAKRLLVHIYCLVMTPIIGFFSTLPAIMALISRPKTFEVVKKS